MHKFRLAIRRRAHNFMIQRKPIILYALIGSVCESKFIEIYTKCVNNDMHNKASSAEVLGNSRAL